MLKVNKEHKKIDVSLIKKDKLKIKRILSSGILLTISVSLLKLQTSLLNEELYRDFGVKFTKEYSYDNDDSFDMSIEFDQDIEKPIYGYTDKELEHAKKASIFLKHNTNLEVLNHMPNLEELVIYVNGKTDSLKTIDGTSFKKPIDIQILPNNNENVYFISDDYSFLKDISEIKSLMLGKTNDIFIIDYTFLSSLKNIYNLRLYLNAYSNFDATNLDYLESLELNGQPYDIPISVSKDEIKYLEDNTKLTISNKDKVTEISNEIENIASSLGVSKESSDKEKLNAILKYILVNYDYPENISNANNYYKNGSLYASLESDKQICGNYAAMLTSLANYLELETYNLISDTHAWNLVRVGNDYFYVDPTFIDSSFVNMDMIYESINPKDFAAGRINKTLENDIDEIDGIEWYLNDVKSTTDITHQPLNLPPNIYPDISINNKDEDIIDLTDKTYDVKFLGKKYTIHAIQLLLLLTCLGSSIYLGYKSIKKDKEKNKGKTLEN